MWYVKSNLFIEGFILAGVNAMNIQQLLAALVAASNNPGILWHIYTASSYCQCKT